MDNKRKLAIATELLSKYFDLSPDVRLLDSLSKINSNLSNINNNIKDESSLSLLEKKINDIIINTSNGCPTTYTIIKNLNDIIKGENLTQQDKDLLNDLIEIYYTENSLLTGTSSDDEKDYSRPTINEILGYSNSSNNTILNLNSSDPTKENPSLSVILSNTLRVSLEQKNINSSVIFLNGIPNVELSRITPYLNVEFFFPRSPTTEKQDNDRIQSLSLIKFLEGARIANKQGAEKLLLDGNKVASEDATLSQAAIEQATQGYTSVGMEIFTAPQTLVNADTEQDYELYINNNETLKELDNKRATPVLDKFRPFLTLNDLELTVVPSKGLMSYKSGNMKLTLHDRSRLNEIAEIIRPDLYGLNEILIEYGWSHPDGNLYVTNDTQNIDNPYGVFLDGMKVKEKYGIINSSFTFKENGEVSITLKIAMRGASAMDTELISSTADNAGNPMKELEEIQKTIVTLRDKVFGNQTDTTKTKEIRGIQILDAAQDVNSFLSLGSELKQELYKMRQQLSKASGGNSDIATSAKELLKKLDELYGPAENQQKGNSNKQGLIKKIKTSIVKNVDQKISKMNSIGKHITPDPWLKDGLAAFNNSVVGKNSKKIKSSYEENEEVWKKSYKTFIKKELGNGYNVMKTGDVSLAKLLLYFVGEPIANTKQYDEIQMLFYPFNANAGLANRINIGNFMVDLTYFMNEFVRYRLENVSKSGNITVSQFLSFIQDRILDQPSSKSYGLHDEDGSFFKTVMKDGELSVQAKDDLPQYNDRLNKAMEEYGCKNGWKQPQIKFYLESLSEELPLEDGISTSNNGSKTILRIHVFDQQANSYTTVQSLLASTRDNEIDQIRSINLNPKPNDKSGNVGVQYTKEQSANKILGAASSKGFLENIGNAEKPIFLIKGGSKQLKNFIQSSMPYIIYGAAGTTILRANLSSIQDPKLNTVNLLRSFNKSELEPNGENPGGLPMRIIPTQLELSMMGCPLIDYAQTYFIDFQTGTTADNVYGVTGITHKISPGNFTTDIKFAPFDGYGKYQSMLEKVGEAITIISKAKSEQNK